MLTIPQVESWSHSVQYLKCEFILWLNINSMDFQVGQACLKLEYEWSAYPNENMKGHLCKCTRELTMNWLIHRLKLFARSRWAASILLTWWVKYKMEKENLPLFSPFIMVLGNNSIHLHVKAEVEGEYACNTCKFR